MSKSAGRRWRRAKGHQGQNRPGRRCRAGSGVAVRAGCRPCLGRSMRFSQLWDDARRRGAGRPPAAGADAEIGQFGGVFRSNRLGVGACGRSSAHQISGETEGRPAPSSHRGSSGPVCPGCPRWFIQWLTAGAGPHAAPGRRPGPTIFWGQGSLCPFQPAPTANEQLRGGRPSWVAPCRVSERPHQQGDAGRPARTSSAMPMLGLELKNGPPTSPAGLAFRPARFVCRRRGRS